MLTRVLLSFLTTAGLFYVNIMPALVDGLKEALHFSNQQAGLIGSANVYGAAVGAFSVVFFVHKINWRKTAVILLAGLIAIDLISMKVSTADPLMAIRFIHGCIGGALVGIGFATIAKTAQPDRTFGMLLLVQFGFGGLGMLLIPQLVEQFGIAVLFISLILFSLVTLMMVPFIPNFDHLESKKLSGSSWKLLASKPLFLALLSIFLFQAANMGLYAFIVGLGKHYGLTIEFISVTLAWAAWVGIAGAALVIWLSTRYGLSKPLIFGISLTALGTWALIYSGNHTIWILANMGVGITWAFVIPYLFAICAQLDTNGQIAAMGGMASKLGLASGPVVTGMLLGDDNYQRVIIIAAVIILLSLGTSLAAVKALPKE
ncbi:MAG: MFS transporter [Proteobacteria bacterium]|nr:MFS transporter [Pseudomonadota bacterium]